MERIKTKKQERYITAIYTTIAVMSVILSWKLYDYQTELGYIKYNSYKARMVFEKDATKRDMFYSEGPFVKPIIELQSKSAKFDKNTTYKLSYKKDNEKNYRVISDNIKFNKRDEVKRIKLGENIDYNGRYIIVLEKLNNTGNKTIVDIQMTENS